jgi:hypothetical protein
MLTNLLLGGFTMVVCLLLQSLLLGVAIHYYSRHKDVLDNPSWAASLLVLNTVLLLLVFGNLGQVAIWALLFRWLGEFSSFEQAFYHSAVNFSTLGYGDIVMSDEHKLLGPLQAINGVLMIGVSTATLMAVLQDALRRTYRTRGH